MSEKNKQTEAAEFEAYMQSLIDAEVKNMDAMSRLELIRYNAETRVRATHMYSLLNIAGNALADMQTRQLLLVDTVNDMIAGKSVKPIDDADLKALTVILEGIEAEGKRYKK